MGHQHFFSRYRPSKRVNVSLATRYIDLAHIQSDDTSPIKSFVQLYSLNPQHGISPSGKTQTSWVSEIALALQSRIVMIVVGC